MIRNVTIIRLLSVLVTCFLVIGTSGADAAFLDQSHTPEPTDFGFVQDFIDRAQTFTVGITGDLTSVDVLLQRDAATTDDLVFDIRTTIAGAPTADDIGANILASGIILASEVSTTTTFVSLDVTGFGLGVTAGDVLAVVLRSTSSVSGAYVWAGGGSYANGSAFDRLGGGFGDTFFDDHIFKTFVVPEPSTITLAALALFGFLAHGHRRRRA